MLFRNMLKIFDCSKKLFCGTRHFHLCLSLQKDDISAKRKVRETVELVTLIDSSDKILGVKTKVEVENLARKLNLSLIKLPESKYGKKHPAYKLISSSDILKDSEKKETSVKSLKRLPLNCRISDHDLDIKVQTIKKWIAKNCQINVAIAGGNSMESGKMAILQKLKEKVGSDGRILEIMNKEDALKFIIIPPKKISQQTTSAKKISQQTTSAKKDISSTESNQETNSDEKSHNEAIHSAKENSEV